MPEEIFVIDWRGWKQKDKNAFIKAMASTAIEGTATFGDESVLYPFYARVIKKWPYSLDPSNVDSYGELEPGEFETVKETVQASFQRFVEEYRQSRVPVGEVRRE